jgi:hypothetical protein
MINKPEVRHKAIWVLPFCGLRQPLIVLVTILNLTGIITQIVNSVSYLEILVFHEEEAHTHKSHNDF